MPQPPLNDEYLATVLNAAPVGMLVADSGSHILFANQQAGAIFGLDPDQLCRMKLEQLIPERHRPGHRELVEQFFASPGYRVMGVGREVLGVSSTGKEIPLEIGLTPFQSDSGPLVIAAVVDITERRQRETDFTLARIVQQSMLPTTAPVLRGLEVAAVSEQADAAGGDFYDYLTLSDGRLAIVIGDASGHGFAAALVTVAARSYLRACSATETDVSRILCQVNSLLLKDDLEGRFVTLFYAALDPLNHRVSYAGAGHTGYLFSASGDLKQQLPSTGPPLGWFPEAEYPCQHLEIAQGDVLMLLTDGIEEAMSPADEQFGCQRLLNCVRDHIGKTPEEITREVHRQVHQFQGNAGQHDDATVLVVRLTQLDSLDAPPES